mgnify:CR=1 FL=1
MNKAGQSIEARWKSDVSGSEERRKSVRREMQTLRSGVCTEKQLAHIT